VKSLDTNILARYYVDDPEDSEAKRQRPIAYRLMTESPTLFVPLTVILELEGVMRGFYEVERETVCLAMEHLVGLPNVTVERWEAVRDAIDLHRSGLDFADALHWACSSQCDELLSFDDRRLVRRAARLGLQPKVTLAT
jgi:predicted nucleic-acid-binding protein